MANNSADAIVRHYNRADEASRLSAGWFQLEQERTRELILRHIQPAPARVLDVGGGAGAYACWLAMRGYEVHLIDPVPRHIAQARAASAKRSQHPLASSEVGDARKLPQLNGSADAVLLLGPIYHLRNEATGRLRCARHIASSGLAASYGSLVSAAMLLCSTLFRMDSSASRNLPRFSIAIWPRASIATRPVTLRTSLTHTSIVRMSSHRN